MKLDARRTMLVGLAFLSICAFWQMYDFVIPLILKNTFLLGDDVTNNVMLIDNVLALFMLPFFGQLSDRSHSRIGRRVPYILGGTAAAVAVMCALPFVNRAGERLLEGVFSGEIARAAFDAQLGRLLTVFLVLLGLVLIAMGVYRAPSVALMPDITPKPLRSRANAIINLMGSVGGIITLVSISLFVKTRTLDVAPQFVFDGIEKLEITNFLPIFYIVAGVMVVSVLALLFTIRENKMRLPEDADAKEGAGGKLPAPMKRSLIFILASVFFWFMGYNAVTTAYSRYFVRVWGDISGAAMCLMIATAGATVAYIPIGYLSAKFGRKKIILAGVLLLAACFGATAFVKSFSYVIYVLFVLVGFSWAAINVNSYPMVVEISRAGNIGKYTGYYYTFSMAAQVATPFVSGQLLERVGYSTLFPYAAIMVLISFVTMLFVHHGDSRPKKAEALVDSFAEEE